MIAQQTLTQLRAMKLRMAAVPEEQINLPTSVTRPFEDRMALLVQGESAYLDNRRLTRLIAKAKLKYARACLEDLDTRHNRGIDTRPVTALSHGQSINQSQMLFICGPTDVGTAWLACALAQKACRLGKSVIYTRVPSFARRTAHRSRRW